MAEYTPFPLLPLEHRTEKKGKGFFSKDYQPLDIHEDHRNSIPWELHQVYEILKLIRCTESTKWGLPHVSKARALAESTVTDENARLLRTYHPAFSRQDANPVGLLRRFDGSQVWIILEVTESVPYTHVAGVPVNFMPHFQNYLFSYFLPGGLMRGDLFQHSINPRRLLADEDLDTFRTMYPRACGVRILLSGVMQVLYPTIEALSVDRREPVSSEAAGARVYFDLLDCTASQASIGMGEPIMENGNPTAPKSTSCIGLRLKMPDNTHAITTSTHGFVRISGNSGFLGSAVDFVWTAKDALTKFWTMPRGNFSLPYVNASQQPTSNTPLGKAVWLRGQNRPLGKIAATFDSPSYNASYPVGFSHDLSLISPMSEEEEDQLPRVDSPAGLPEINGWTPITDALEGHPLFITPTVAHKGEVLDEETLKLIRDSAQIVAAEGIQYVWDRETRSQSVALLWRDVTDPKTVAAAPKSQSFVDLPGFSGNVVCLGKPTDKTVKALVFQNFQAIFSVDREERHTIKKDGPRVVMKGGFVLPTFVYDKCTVDHGVCGLENTEKKFVTI